MIRPSILLVANQVNRVKVHARHTIGKLMHFMLHTSYMHSAHRVLHQMLFDFEQHPDGLRPSHKLFVNSFKSHLSAQFAFVTAEYSPIPRPRRDIVEYVVGARRQMDHHHRITYHMAKAYSLMVWLVFMLIRGGRSAGL